MVSGGREWLPMLPTFPCFLLPLAKRKKERERERELAHVLAC